MSRGECSVVWRRVGSGQSMSPLYFYAIIRRILYKPNLPRDNTLETRTKGTNMTEKNRGYQLKDFEKETIILGNEEKDCMMEIETFNARIIKLLRKNKNVTITSEKIVEGSLCVKAKFPMKIFCISAGKNELSDEQRVERSERMKKMLAKKKLERKNEN